MASDTLAETFILLRRRKVSSVENTRRLLARIDAVNPAINAYITVSRDLGMEQARAAEAEIVAGHWRGPLHGLPISLKDNIDTAGVVTTAASRLFAARVPAEDAEIIRRLKAARP